MGLDVRFPRVRTLAVLRFCDQHGPLAGRGIPEQPTRRVSRLQGCALFVRSGLPPSHRVEGRSVRWSQVVTLLPASRFGA